MENEENEIEWWGFNLSDARDFTKCVKKIQSQCRSSLEYDTWSLRTKMHEQQCPVCEEPYEFIKAETHHYPQTMYNVCADAFQVRIEENTMNDVMPLDMVQEIMGKHLAFRVDNIVLCEQCHKRFHNDCPDTIDVVIKLWHEKQELKKKKLETQIKIEEEERKDEEDNDSILINEVVEIENKESIIPKEPLIPPPSSKETNELSNSLTINITDLED